MPGTTVAEPQAIHERDKPSAHRHLRVEIIAACLVNSRAHGAVTSKDSMKNMSIALCVLALSLTGLVGCDLFRDEPEGPIEEIGAAIDDTAEDVEDSVEDVAEEVDESVH